MGKGNGIWYYISAGNLKWESIAFDHLMHNA